MAKKPKAKKNVAENKRKELAAQLGEAVIVREKLAEQLNNQSLLCNQLATEMEKL